MRSTQKRNSSVLNDDKKIQNYQSNDDKKIHNYQKKVKEKRFKTKENNGNWEEEEEVEVEEEEEEVEEKEEEEEGCKFCATGRCSACAAFSALANSGCASLLTLQCFAGPTRSTPGLKTADMFLTSTTFQWLILKVTMLTLPHCTNGFLLKVQP